MSDSRSAAAQPTPIGSGPDSSCPGRDNWKPVLTLLLLSPATGELLSGSSPPLQFFNPVFLLLLMGLYGCGALLVRETVALRRLNAAGLLLLGAAYGIVEEGLMCKSFFNPFWTDTGYLSVYGRAGGVNWVWAFGLTFYHMAISIAAPIFITEALFPLKAQQPWLRRRGRTIAGLAFAAVVLLGFVTFDNRQFHLIEMNNAVALAHRLEAAGDPLTRFMAEQLTPKQRELVRNAAATHTESSDLKHALQDVLNRLLARSDLYAPERFSGVALPGPLKQQTARPPRGDKLIEFNRGLLQAAFPGILPARQVYPFRPGWVLTLACVLVVCGLVGAALAQTNPPISSRILRKPWLTGVSFTAGFVIVGFVLPSLVEHGVHIPAVVVCLIWCALGVMLGAVLRRSDADQNGLWRRGLWALGAITPWVFFALLLGVVVGMIGAKSFLGMPFVSFAFGTGILVLTLKWRRRLALFHARETAPTAHGSDSPLGGADLCGGPNRTDRQREAHFSK